MLIFLWFSEFIFNFSNCIIFLFVSPICLYFKVVNCCWFIPTIAHLLFHKHTEEFDAAFPNVWSEALLFELVGDTYDINLRKM